MGDQIILDEVADEIVEAGFYFLATGNNRGKWIKRGDRIGSYFLVKDDMLQTVRGFTRDKIREHNKSTGGKKSGQYVKPNTNTVMEIMKMVEERNHYTREDFKLDRRVIHFQNGFYFLDKDIFMPRTAEVWMWQRNKITGEIKHSSLILPEFPQFEEKRVWNPIDRCFCIERTYIGGIPNPDIDNWDDTPINVEDWEKHNIPNPNDYQLKTFSVIPHDYDPDINIDLPPLSWEIFLFHQQDLLPLYEFEHALEIAFSDNEYETAEQAIERWWEWNGYIQTNSVHLKKACLYRGLTDSGKTKISEIQQYVLGKEKCTDQTLHDICSKKLGVSGAIYQKKLCYDDDMGSGVINNNEAFKKVTGYKSMDVRFLHENSFKGENTVKFQGCANAIPPVRNLDTSFTNRWIIFFFDHVFVNDEDSDDYETPDDLKDDGFLRRMCQHHVAQYIIKKSLLALKRVNARGYFKGMTKEEVMHYWSLESNIIYNFIENCCLKGVPRRDSEIQGELYNKFVEYCDVTEINSDWVKSQTIFTKYLKRYGYPVADGGRRTVWDEATATEKHKHVRVYQGLKIDEARFSKLFSDEEPEVGEDEDEGFTQETIDVQFEEDWVDGIVIDTQTSETIKETAIEILESRPDLSLPKDKLVKLVDDQTGAGIDNVIRALGEMKNEKYIEGEKVLKLI